MQTYRRGPGMVGRAPGAAALLATALALGACNRAPPAAPAAMAPAAPRPALDPALVAANRTMAPGVPIGEASAPIEARFDVPEAPLPGAPFTVNVAVLPGAPAPLLRLEVSAAEGLAVLAPDSQVTREKVAAGSVVALAIRAQSAEAGARIVFVRATLELPEGPQTRTFAFPVLVRAAAAQAPPGGKSTP